MAVKMFESSTLSAYCESMAMMLSAGIQTDEAVYLLGENMQDSDFKQTCDSIYRSLLGGNTLSAAMKHSGAFPPYVIDMVGAGEFSGRLENVFISLARYYDEEDRLFSKIKSAIAYPAALLAVMTVILLFTVSAILPVFISVYEGLSGGIATSSYAYINASIIIGWVAFAITLVCTVFVVIGVAMTSSQKGRIKLMGLLERLPITRKPMRQMALGRFTSSLATYIASGVDADAALADALGMVEHAQLRASLEKVQSETQDQALGKGLAQSLYDNDIFDPIYARMLLVGSRTGSLEEVLEHLAETFSDESIMQIDGLIDSVEPTLAAFLTISVGATLISVMLPLIGIMGSIG